MLLNYASATGKSKLQEGFYSLELKIFNRSWTFCYGTDIEAILEELEDSVSIRRVER